MTSSRLTIATIPGDGIGPEVTTEALRVLRAAIGDAAEVRATEYTLALLVQDISDSVAGYAKELDATTEGIIGFSAGAVTLTGTSDGDHSVKVDLSTESVYAFPPDAGTATIALIGKSMDMGADGKSVNIDATVIDCVTCVWVDATNNIVYVKRMPASMGTV
jgi:hypothetical protein